MSPKRKANKCKTNKNDDKQDKTKEKVQSVGNASPEHIRSRTFKKAHRKTPPQSNAGTSGFTGLLSGKGSASVSGPLKYFKPDSSETFSVPSFQAAKPNVLNNTLSTIEQASQDEYSNDVYFDVPSPMPMSVYNRHVSALNRSVSSWIAESVDTNPICDLSPIFMDYNEHLGSIREKRGKSDKPSKIFITKLDNRPTPTSKIETSSEVATSSKASPGKNFTAISSPFKGFGSLLNKAHVEGTFKGFKFNSPNMSSPLAVSPSAARCPQVNAISENLKESPNSDLSKEQSTMENKMPLLQAEDGYVPPEPEKAVVREKDSIFTTKCKLFYMKDESYAEKGIGYLHLKPIPSSTKTHLLIRADNPLGTPLLNISLDPAMPVKKEGKNNVRLSCISNPPIDEDNPNKIFPMLIRVKTSNEADRLLDLLEEKKKESS